MFNKVTMHKNRVIIVGIDGATFGYLNPLMRRGIMPRLATFFQEGQSSTLYSTIPPMTAPAWVSFMTGCSPGRHGIFSFFKDFGRSKQESVKFTDITYPTFWDLLGEEGKQVILINVPMTYPPQPVNGILISGMLTPSTESKFVYPAELATKVGKDYVIDLDYRFQGDENFPEKKVLLEDCFHMTKKRGELAEKLMKEHPWDLFVVVFTGPDRVCHFLWDDLENLIDGDGSKNSPLAGKVSEYFHMLDGYIGRLFDLSPSAVRIVLSDHGFGPVWQQTVHLPELLLQFESSATLSFSRMNTLLKSRRTVTKLWQLAGRIGVRRLVEIVMNNGGSKALNAYLPDKVDVFELYGYIFAIALSDKLTDKEKRRLTSYITRELLKFRAGKSKDRIVRHIYTREEIYAGEKVELLPEIIVELFPEYGVSTQPNEEGLVLSRNPNTSRLGDHRAEGVFGIRDGKISTVRDLNIIDVAPTILQFFDLTPPAFMQGRGLRGD